MRKVLCGVQILIDTAEPDRVEILFKARIPSLPAFSGEVVAFWICATLNRSTQFLLTLFNTSMRMDQCVSKSHKHGTVIVGRFASDREEI